MDDPSSSLEAKVLSFNNKNKADFILLVDGSSSMAPEHWDIIRFSSRHLLSRIDLKKSRAAIVQFSKHARVEHEFSNDSYSLQLVINNLHQMQENTNLATALELCSDMFIASTTDAEPVVILLTDGDATDAPENKALFMREHQGVQIIGIGVGKGVSRVKLEKVASLNSCFLISSMEELRTIFTKIGTHAFDKPNVKILRRFCDKLEIEIGCSGLIAEFIVELFDPNSDTTDKYILVKRIPVPNPNEALIKSFITGLKSSTTFDFRVHAVLKSNGKRTDYVYIKDNTLDQKRDSGMLRDPLMLKNKTNELLEALRQFRPPQYLTEQLGLLDVKVALLGRVGEGKSSFINTTLSVNSGFFHQVAVAMTHNKTVTSELTLYPLEGTHILLMDSYGWEDDNYSHDEQKLICEGILGHGFKEGQSQADYLLRNNNQQAPSFNRSVHGVIIVCDADAVTNKTFMARLKQFELTWKKFKRSLVIVLTKCDNADQELHEHPESIYESEIVEKRIATLSALTGIDKGDIYPCVNRTGLNVPNPEVREYLALRALHSCIFSAVTGVLKAEHSRLSIQLRELLLDGLKSPASNGVATPQHTPHKSQHASPEAARSPYAPPKPVEPEVVHGDPEDVPEPNPPHQVIDPPRVVDPVPQANPPQVDPPQPNPQANPPHQVVDPPRVVDPLPQANPAPPQPAQGTSKELLIELQNNQFVEVTLFDHTIKGLKEAIVSIEEFGLTYIDEIAQVSKIKETNGTKCEVLIRNDADVGRLLENQVIRFKLIL